MPEGDDLPPTGQPARLVPGETPLRTHNRDTVPETLPRPGGLARTSASGTAAAGRAPHGNTAVGAPHITHRSRGRAPHDTHAAAAGAARHAPQQQQPYRARVQHTRTPFTQNTPRHYKHGARLQNGVFFHGARA